MWASHHRENVGDAEAAVLDATRALELTRPDDGPWMGAVLNTELAVLHAQLGRLEESERHALAALPVLDALEANDDAIQARSLLAVTAMTRGDLDGGRAPRRRDGPAPGAADGLLRGVRAHHRPRRAGAWPVDRVEEGLTLYRQAVARAGRAAASRAWGCTHGLEPWVIFAEGAAATAYAVHGTDDAGHDLQASLAGQAAAVAGPRRAAPRLPDRRARAPRARRLGCAARHLPAGRRGAAAGAGRAVRLPPLHPDARARAAPSRPRRTPRPGCSTGSATSCRRAAARTSCRRPGPSPSGRPPATSSGRRSAPPAARRPRRRPHSRAAPRARARSARRRSSGRARR